MSENEGAGYWLSVFDELKSRGIERLGFVCIDGLKGLEEAITETFPGAIVCRCMVHLVRNSTKNCPDKEPQRILQGSEIHIRSRERRRG